ncbi:MAG: hypothetical protein KKA19_00995 [Candidatus Margulisbacteria bacterium]|nr:hypothetical protein [Candidatus Margulisiibacteriota bacterium]
MNCLKKNFKNKLFTLIIVLFILNILCFFAYAYDPHAGFFLPAEVIVSNNNLVIVDMRVGGITGTAFLNTTYRTDTILTSTIAQMSLTKNYTITAPASYIAKGGGVNDPVPGATIIYVLSFLNSNTETANSVEIVDYINTANIAYSTANGGIQIQWNYGAGFVSAPVPAIPADNTVQSVKWTIGDVAPLAGGTVTLNVIIK